LPHADDQPLLSIAVPGGLSGGKQSVSEFTTEANGYRLSTSVGGVLTGRGADVIIIDDPLKPDEALSEARRGSVNEWYDYSLYSRLNDKQRGAIVIIMQRLHEDDLVGHVLEQEGWGVVRLPAIAEQEEAFAIETALGLRRFSRKPGDLLHPAREPAETLERIRRTMGSIISPANTNRTPPRSGAASSNGTGSEPSIRIRRRASTASSKAGTLPPRRRSFRTIASAPPGDCGARRPISSVFCAAAWTARS
jgi:hypothetical protein